jgi:phage-related protein
MRIMATTDNIATALRIDNLTNGKYFIYNAVITAGKWIEIDTDLLTVVDDTGANKLSSFSGDFFKLEAGDNSIKWTGTASGAVKPSYSMTYRGKYDGV